MPAWATEYTRPEASPNRNRHPARRRSQGFPGLSPADPACHVQDCAVFYLSEKKVGRLPEGLSILPRADSHPQMVSRLELVQKQAHEIGP